MFSVGVEPLWNFGLVVGLDGGVVVYGWRGLPVFGWLGLVLTIFGVVFGSGGWDGFAGNQWQKLSCVYRWLYLF